jgi:hypothetical protein
MEYPLDQVVLWQRMQVDAAEHTEYRRPEDKEAAKRMSAAHSAATEERLAERRAPRTWRAGTPREPTPATGPAQDSKQ